MKIVTELYSSSIQTRPATGKRIIGHQADDCIVVYQAYKPEIAEFALKNQRLGGSNFSYDRMSWIKPGFLWMMYRCGWATKADQEHVLAIWISKTDFLKILLQAVPATYKPKQYSDPSLWKDAMKFSEVRLQWDPDHDPYGRKEDRKAIQLGLKGSVLKSFGNEYIRHIEDITAFVHEQRLVLDKHDLAELQVPAETVMEIEDLNIRHIIDLS